MSEKKVFACDTCNKLTDHPQSTKGWITVGGNINYITRYDGVKFGASEWGSERSIEQLTDPDFCSIKCLLDYFKTRLNITVDEDFEN